MYQRKLLMPILDLNVWEKAFKNREIFNGMSIAGVTVAAIGLIGRAVMQNKMTKQIGNGWCFTSNDGHTFEKVCEELNSMNGKIFND